MFTYVHVLDANGWCPVCGEHETWLVANGHQVVLGNVVALRVPGADED